MKQWQHVGGYSPHDGQLGAARTLPQLPRPPQAHSYNREEPQLARPPQALSAPYRAVQPTFIQKLRSAHVRYLVSLVKNGKTDELCVIEAVTDAEAKYAFDAMAYTFSVQNFGVLFQKLQ